MRGDANSTWLDWLVRAWGHLADRRRFLLLALLVRHRQGPGLGSGFVDRPRGRVTTVQRMQNAVPMSNSVVKSERRSAQPLEEIDERPG